MLDLYALATVYLEILKPFYAGPVTARVHEPMEGRGEQNLVDGIVTPVFLASTFNNLVNPQIFPYFPKYQTWSDYISAYRHYICASRFMKTQNFGTKFFSS
jgi:hypothetical protein